MASVAKKFVLYSGLEILGCWNYEMRVKNRYQE